MSHSSNDGNAELDIEQRQSEDVLPWEEDIGTERAIAVNAHPIIRQIIDRDCHVATPSRDVVRHVISKLKDGYETLRSMSEQEREALIDQCVNHHAENWKMYVEVMSGFTQSVTKARSTHSPSLKGKELISLMRKHKVTIKRLSFRMGLPMKRIREVRAVGLNDALAVRDWIQAVTGEDPGPIPSEHRITGHAGSAECNFCGCPLEIGDIAFAYLDEVFCSANCCRKSRGW